MAGLYVMRAVGHVRSAIQDLEGSDWVRATSTIVLNDELFGRSDLEGLAEFSHLAVLFVMGGDSATRGAEVAEQLDWPKVGVFARRGKNRPNALGLTICRVAGVEGLQVRVEGLDAVDGTPVLDLKPWMTPLGPRGLVHEPAWVEEVLEPVWNS